MILASIYLSIVLDGQIGNKDPAGPLFPIRQISRIRLINCYGFEGRQTLAANIAKLPELLKRPT
jgi:hypothetical protein